MISGRVFAFTAACCLAAAALLFSSPVFAQDQRSGISISITAQKEVTETKDGKTVTRLVPAEKATAGDIILYTINYKNKGQAPAQAPEIVDPVPEAAAYVEGSAEGKDTEILVSIDKGASFVPPPAMQLVRQPDGTMKQEKAPPEMVTHVKWIVKGSLAPGASGAVSFKARVK